MKECMFVHEEHTQSRIFFLPGDEAFSDSAVTNLLRLLFVSISTSQRMDAYNLDRDASLERSSKSGDSQVRFEPPALPLLYCPLSSVSGSSFNS